MVTQICTYTITMDKIIGLCFAAVNLKIEKEMTEQVTRLITKL